MTRRVRLLLLVAGALLVWNAALFAAPLASAPRLSALTYMAGARICHQQPDRSFHVAGAQVPVCARCLGLYGGAAIGALGWVVVAGLRQRPHARARRWLEPPIPRVALVTVALPTLLSVALGMLGVWDGTNTVRATLALPLGAVIAAVIAAAAAGDLR